MWAVIVGELHMGDFVSPETGVASTEDPEVCFNFLVDPFSFTVRLEVICSREGEDIIKEFSKFLDEDRGELWTTIRDDYVIYIV